MYIVQIRDATLSLEYNDERMQLFRLSNRYIEIDSALTLQPIYIQWWFQGYFMIYTYRANNDWSRENLETSSKV